MTYLHKAVAYFLRHEVYLFLALFLGFLPLVWAAVDPMRWAARRLLIGKILRGLALLVLAGFCWVTFRYLALPVYFEPVEPQVSEVSWNYLQGHPLYEQGQSAQVYNLPYGPVLYLVVGWCNKLFGPSVLAGKLPGVLANVLMLAVLFFVYRRQISPGATLLALGLAAAMFLRADGTPITGRSDSILCLLVALGLWLVAQRRAYAPVAFGLLVGLAMNCKVHSALYFIPVAAVAWNNGYTFKQGLVAAGCALAIFLAPFFLLPDISLGGYAWFIASIVGHGLSMIKLQQLLWCGTVVAVPAVAGWLALRGADHGAAVTAVRANAKLIGGFAAAFVLLLFPASKVGAGPHHLMPWLVAIPALAIPLYQSGLGNVWGETGGRLARVFLLSWVCAVLASALLALGKINSLLEEHAGEGAKVVADVQDILKTHDKDYLIFMGVGGQDDYWLTSYRELLTFDGQPVGIDWVALMDYKRAGLKEPELARLLEQFQAKSAPPKGALWLVPKGDVPFSIKTFYPPQDVLFTQPFRDDFKLMFQRTGSSEYFDIYTPTGALPADRK